MVQNSLEREVSQINRVRVSVQYNLAHGPPHRGRHLQSVSAESIDKHIVCEDRVSPNDCILIQCVVFVVARPATLNLESDTTT